MLAVLSSGLFALEEDDEGYLFIDRGQANAKDVLGFLSPWHSFRVCLNVKKKKKVALSPTTRTVLRGWDFFFVKDHLLRTGPDFEFQLFFPPPKNDELGING